MDLVKKYVYAVTQKLPEQQRSDIQQELTGLIEDMLEQRVWDGTIHENDVEEVLIELGDPSELAAKYRGKERYLISPEMFDPFVTVMKVVLASIAVAISVASIIELILNPTEIVKQFAEYVVTLLTACIQGFAWVTIIFALVEWKGGRNSKRTLNTKKSWNPSDLPSIPNPRTLIKVSEPIFGIIISILSLVLFTFALNLVGVHRYNDGLYWVIPVFDEEVFSKYIPFIWVITAIAILRDCLKMMTRKWTPEIVISHLFFNITSLILIFMMFSNPSIWNADFMNQLEHAGLISMGSEVYQTVMSIWNNTTKGGLIIIIAIITIIDSVSVGMKLYRK